MKAPESVLRWISLIDKNRHPDIPLSLVLAVLWQENGPGDRYATRYEPGYQYFYDYKRDLALYDKTLSVAENRQRALNILGPTEFHTQSTSWGLMQLMGAAARERRFKAPYLAELCDPEANIVYGTLHLWQWGFAHGKKSTYDALVRWNGSAKYAGEVLTKLAAVEA